MVPRRWFLLALSWLPLVALGPGCSTLGYVPEPGYEELERSVDAFSKFVRWKQYAKAKLFVVPNRERAFVKFTQSVENVLDITEFSVDDVTIDEADEKAGLRTEGHALVRLSYTLLPSNVYHVKVIEQIWIAKDGQWMLDFPAKGWDL
ncbi:MAG: hypothetical protein IPK07_29490 [Deltaproteobacteria bacterium]|nr:hypothetical protein [Deltaproteobacteria bacterium]